MEGFGYIFIGEGAIQGPTGGSLMKAKVYLARVKDGAEPERQAKAARSALLATGFIDRLMARDMVAIKVHVGERHNDTHAPPEIAAAMVAAARKAKAQCFITDTSTLYKGRRENAIVHALHAHDHGFSIENTGAPFLPVDGLSGTDEAEVEIKGELFESVKVAGQILLADAMIMISHPTGHPASGLGAAIKNAGMGLASRAGKMRQHSSITPEVDAGKCTNCGKCRKWCPKDAISEKDDVSYIHQKSCIGCGECIAVCRFGAIMWDWKIESPVVQRSIAEYAAGALRHFGDKAVFINALTNMTQDCDCFNRKQKKIIPDVGIVASTDIVAADQATLDLTIQEGGKNLAQLSYGRLDSSIQLDHAVKMGLGTREYEIEEVK